MLTIADTLSFYKREDVQDELVRIAQNREIAIKYGDKGFGKRPDVLNYKNDVLELARNRATSFHASEELWSNPLLLRPDLKTSELNDLRIGWDLILDIDCHFFEYSRLAALLIIDVLKGHGIKSVSCKFSGNKGFHIAVPFEAFPKRIHGKETRLLFPEAPRKIAFYIKELIKEKLGDEILKFEGNSFSSVIKKVNKPMDEIVYYKRDKFGERIPRLNTEAFLEIDTILISPRHLFRMPYSMHEKSGLVSTPIRLDYIKDFKKEDAIPEKVIVEKNLFLNKNGVEEGEAKVLLLQAYDFAPQDLSSVKSINKNVSANNVQFNNKIEIIQSPLSKDYFAPCIKNILNGLEDGRKRSVFILLNYLTSLGWDYDSIQELLLDWNKKNKEPLRENYILGQIRYHKQNWQNKKQKVLPPNCSNQMYYKDIGVCTPDSLCEKIKNPVNYSLIKRRRMLELEKNKAGNRSRRKRRQKKEKEKTEEGRKERGEEGRKKIKAEKKNKKTTP